MPNWTYVLSAIAYAVLSLLSIKLLRSARDWKRELYRQSAPAMQALRAALAGISNPAEVVERRGELINLMEKFQVREISFLCDDRIFRLRL